MNLYSEVLNRARRAFNAGGAVNTALTQAISALEKIKDLEARCEDLQEKLDRVSVGKIEEAIDRYYHLSLYKSDKTFSEVWGIGFTAQEAKLLAQEIYNEVFKEEDEN